MTLRVSVFFYDVTNTDTPNIVTSKEFSMLG